ncbi:MAG TPA: diguanylate cyclase [Burkholderiales bacterium]|nr:diguanylate cyclase [Burkholderiales bacterium]
MTNLKTRARILVLVLLAALPALVLTVYSALERRASEESRARAELVRLAKLAAMQQWQVVESARQMMVASQPILVTLLEDGRRCTEYFGNLLAQNRDSYHAMGLFDESGNLLCNAKTWRAKVYSGDRLYFRLAKETGRFAVGEYQIGRVTGQAGINFGYPVKDARNKVRAVAFAGLDLEDLARIAEATPLPPNGILSVIDVKGTILSRKPALNERIGEKLWNSQVIESILAGSEGVLEVEGENGVNWLLAHQVIYKNPDGAFPLRVLITVPLSQVFAEANRALVRDLLGIVLATLFLLVAAWFGAELFMLRKFRALLRAAERMRSGDLNARTGIQYGREELGQLARAFDDMAGALQLRERRLQEQAISDPLTGLYNRRYLNEFLPRELARSGRNATPVAVMLLDLDRFKGVNDSFGHEAGDLVLSAVANLLRGKVRGSDIACRYGGEEFALVLPETGLEPSARRAEDIRVAISALDLRYAGKYLGRMTASIGIALFPDHSRDADGLLRVADIALYAAKGAGRDRVVVAHGIESEMAERVGAGSDGGQE